LAIVASEKEQLNKMKEQIKISLVTMNKKYMKKKESHKIAAEELYAIKTMKY